MPATCPRSTSLPATGGHWTIPKPSCVPQALDAGEISLLDYIVELGLYYTTVDDALAAERDYELALTELQSVML